MEAPLAFWYQHEKAAQPARRKTVQYPSSCDSTTPGGGSESPTAAFDHLQRSRCQHHRLFGSEVIWRDFLRSRARGVLDVQGYVYDVIQIRPEHLADPDVSIGVAPGCDPSQKGLVQRGVRRVPFTFSLSLLPPSPLLLLSPLVSRDHLSFSGLRTDLTKEIPPRLVGLEDGVGRPRNVAWGLQEAEIREGHIRIDASSHGSQKRRRHKICRRKGILERRRKRSTVTRSLRGALGRLAAYPTDVARCDVVADEEHSPAHQNGVEDLHRRIPEGFHNGCQRRRKNLIGPFKEAQRQRSKIARPPALGFGVHALGRGF
eukprot:scaffold1088_cov247-Pinguiococcus_pyrenoidosus.AAC.3